MPKGMRIPNSTVLFLLLLVISITACAPKSRISPLAARTDIREGLDFHSIRSKIKSDLKTLDKTLDDSQTKEKLLDIIKSLKDDYRALGRSIPPKSNMELLQQYCEVMLGILSDFEAQFRRKYKKAEQDAFVRLKRMDRELLNEFEPGIFEKISRLLKKMRTP